MSSVPAFKYNAFISYSHAVDGRLSKALQSALKRYAIPWYKRAKLSIFVDESDLSVTPHLWNNIQYALERSEYLIYMASVRSSRSKWVGRELKYWLENKDLSHLIIVITDGECHWNDKTKCFDNLQDSALHPILFDTFDQEPFYIDARQLKLEEDFTLKNSLFNREVLKIASELYGVSQHKLAGEETRTRKKVRAITWTAIMTLIIALGTITFFYKEAQINEKEAINQEQNAKNLLRIALQGRGDRYEGKDIELIIDQLNKEIEEPLKNLIVPKASLSKVGINNNYDYQVWIDIPSFKSDSIKYVKYIWPQGSYNYARGSEIISYEPSTGYSFGFRGINKISDILDIEVYILGKSDPLKLTFPIRDYLNNLGNNISPDSSDGRPREYLERK